MPQTPFWPQDEIQALFESALATGEAAVELPDPTTARLFYFACFNWRRPRKHFRQVQISRPRDSRRVTFRRRSAAPIQHVEVEAAQ